MNLKPPALCILLPTKGPSPTPLVPVDALLPAANTPPEPHMKRRHIWEIAGNFHCSIIGTCLSTAELRQILLKMQLPGVHKENDHQLHGRAVLLAGQKDGASRLLQKALDRRHRSTIHQFSKARTADDLRTHWQGAVQRAEIPGAYWAVLTHPQATEDLVRDVFGEVHMLSHLVGAANRADIRRLRDLETENAVLQETIARQQKHLRDAIVSRDAKIAGLNDMLGNAVAARRGSTPAEQSDDGRNATTAALMADLQERLARATAGRERGELRLRSLIEKREGEKQQRRLLEKIAQDLRREIEAAEICLSAALGEAIGDDAQSGSLASASLLYVGGRSGQIAQLRRIAEQHGGLFFHHDGGIDDRSGLLEAHVARADVTFFPVDCVSHNAVAVVKRVARSVGRPYVPLRSAGLASFTAALRQLATPQPERSESRQAPQLSAAAP